MGVKYFREYPEVQYTVLLLFLFLIVVIVFTSYMRERGGADSQPDRETGKHTERQNERYRKGKCY